MIRKIVLSFLAAFTTYSSAQVAATISIPNNACCSVSVNPNTNRVFTSGGASSGQAVVMIDGNTNAVLQTLGTGSGARVNPVTNKVYAGAVFSPFQGFLVYDGATGALLKTITTFDCPIAAAVDATTNRIWGSAQCGGGNDAVFVIDGSTDTLLNPPGRIGSGGVMGFLVVNPVNHIVYIAPSSISRKVNPTTFAVSTTPFSGTVISVNPVHNRLYGLTPNQVQVIDGVTEAILTAFPAFGSSTVNAAIDRVYVADNLSHAVLVLDGASNQILGSIPVPATFSLGEIAVNSSTGTLYLAATTGSVSNVFVINDNVAQATQQLSVTLAGTGSGVVTSSPAGINCGSTCTATFNSSVLITLTASTDASSVFTGWNGCDNSS